MELFFADDIRDARVRLDPEESAHCVRVLRHRAGDEISVIDGRGTLYRCALELADAKGAEARILERTPGFGSHPYHLTMAVCPTKNIDRYEWFVEKATEVGVDVVLPVIGERSERKVFKPERCRKIALSAMKQSLKASLPAIEDPLPLKDFITRAEGLKMICCCFEGETPRRSVSQVLEDAPEGCRISILIGPEGDFSPEEVQLAVEHGFVPVHLGPSRLRTETAALTAVMSVYLDFIH